MRTLLARLALLFAVCGTVVDAGAARASSAPAQDGPTPLVAPSAVARPAALPVGLTSPCSRLQASLGDGFAQAAGCTAVRRC